ncbi:MAG: AfsR/SARP family transcriptional regulator [Actinocatenispora sp.]
MTPSPPPRYTLLGTVGITCPDAVPAITACKVRTVLAVLLLAGGRRVTTEQLVDHVWPDQPPASAVKNLQLYVHRLRRALTLANRATPARNPLVRTPDGYCLLVDPASVDMLVAESLAERAEQAATLGRVDAAADLLRQALSGWSENPVGGVTRSARLVAVTRRLQERRLALLERQCELDLMLGRHIVAADQLRGLVDLHPFRESLHALLITALARSGHRAEAIGVFHQLRRRLLDELAIGPGVATRAAYQDMLQSDRVPPPGMPA